MPTTMLNTASLPYIRTTQSRDAGCSEPLLTIYCRRDVLGGCNDSREDVVQLWDSAAAVMRRRRTCTRAHAAQPQHLRACAAPAVLSRKFLQRGF